MSAKAIFVSASGLSDAELQRALQELSATLASERAGPVASHNEASAHAHTWRARRHALLQLQHFAEEDISTRPRFTQWMSMYAKVPLIEHLQDSRRSVAESACAAVRSFARHSSNRSAWHTMSGWLTPTLLRMAASSTTSAASTVQHTLDVIARAHGYGSEAFGELLKHSCGARHATTRLYALQTLSTVLQVTKGTAHQLALSKYLVPVCRTIRTTLTDADSSVRRASRRCYWALSSIEPEGAERLYGSLTGPVLQLLEAERESALRLVGVVPATRDPNGSKVREHHYDREERDGRFVARDTASDDVAVNAQERSMQLCFELWAVTAARVRYHTGRGGNRYAGGRRRVERAPYNASRKCPGASAVARAPVRVDSSHSAPAEEGDTSVGELEEVWPEIKALLRSSAWSARVRACDMLLPHTRHFPVEYRAECVNALVPRMSDQHFRVCAAALECFRGLLTCHGDVTVERTQLHSVLLALITSTASTKETIAGAARELLVALIKSAGSIDEVLAHLQECLSDDTITMKVRSRVVEVLQFVYEAHYTHFMQAVPMREAVKVLGEQLRLDRRPGSFSPVWVSATQALTTLYAVARTTFVRTVVELSEGDQLLLRTAMAALLGDLQSDCELAVRGDVTAFSSSRSPTITADLVRAPFRESLSHLSLPPAALSRGRITGAGNFQQQWQSSIVLNGKHPSQTAAPAPMTRGIQAGTVPIHSYSHAPYSVKQATATLFDSCFSPKYYKDPFADDLGPSAHVPLNHAAWPDEEPLFVFKGIESDVDRRSTGQPKHAGCDCAALQRLFAHSGGARDRCTALAEVAASLPQHPQAWAAQSACERLLHLLERLSMEQYEPDHCVRCAALRTLRIVLETRSLQPSAARQLVGILSATHAAMDDAFVEVQQEGASTTHTALSACCMTTDMCLGALATCVEKWRRGPARDYCTRGCLELLLNLGRLFERRGTQAPSGRGATTALTAVVLRRVAAAVHGCMDHCAAQVRRTALLVYVSMWMYIGDEVLVFFSELSESQREMVSILYNKARGNHPGPRNLAEEMRLKGLPEALCA